MYANTRPRMRISQSHSYQQTREHSRTPRQGAMLLTLANLIEKTPKPGDASTAGARVTSMMTSLHAVDDTFSGGGVLPYCRRRSE